VTGGTLGQGRVGAAALEGLARNPGASAKIQTLSILVLAIVESLVICALGVAFFMMAALPK
jgi:F-type H+-transporting ATPase subunit c